MCCDKIRMSKNAEIKFLEGSFIFDQMLFDYPVFRHESYVDLFLYRSRTGWVVGKGLSGQNLAYRASVEGGNCPTWTGQNWQFRSQGDNMWKPSNLQMGCPSFWSNWSSWSSCSDACLLTSVATRNRQCSKSKHSSEVIIPCEGIDSEEKSCECKSVPGSAD